MHILCKALDRPRPVLVQGFWLRCWYVCVCGGEWGETGRMGSKTGFILACTRSALDPPVLDRTHAYMTFARAGCSGSLVVVDQFPPLVRGFGGVHFGPPLPPRGRIWFLLLTLLRFLTLSGACP